LLRERGQGLPRTVGTIPDHVRRPALHALSTLPPVPTWRLAQGTHILACLHPPPTHSRSNHVIT